MTRARSIRAATIALALLCAKPAMAGEIVGPARVIDGDTLEISGQRVRLAGIDAPEMEQSCAMPLPSMTDHEVRSINLGCGEDAAKRLKKMVGAIAIICTAIGHDRYDRIVATCSTSATGGDIGEAMVRDGWAVRYPQYDPSGRYTAAEAEARRERRGIWAGKFEMPWVWRKKHR